MHLEIKDKEELQIIEECLNNNLYALTITTASLKGTMAASQEMHNNMEDQVQLDDGEKEELNKAFAEATLIAKQTKGLLNRVRGLAKENNLKTLEEEQDGNQDQQIRDRLNDGANAGNG